MKQIARGRWASLFHNNILFWIDTDCGYIGGTDRDPNFDPILLSPNATDEALGDAIRTSLLQSRWVLYPSEHRDMNSYPREVEFDARLHPNDRKEKYAKDVKMIMRRFKIKTKNELFSNMKYCSITNERCEITFKPTHHNKLDRWSWSKNGIPREPFENVIIPASSIPDEIGVAARLALSRCTG